MNKKQNLNRFKYYEKELKLLKELYENLYSQYFVSNNKTKIEELIGHYERKIIKKMSRILQEIDKVQNPLLRQILLLKINGNSQIQIAKRLNYSVSYIKQLLWEYYNNDDTM